MQDKTTSSRKATKRATGNRADSNRPTIKLSTPANARRVLDLMRAERKVNSIQVGEMFDQLTDSTGVTLEHPAFAVRAVRMAAEIVEATPKPKRRGGDVQIHFAHQAYTDLAEILERVESGEAIGSFITKREAQFQKNQAERTPKPRVPHPVAGVEVADELTAITPKLCEATAQRLIEALESGDTNRTLPAADYVGDLWRRVAHCQFHNGNIIGDVRDELRTLLAALLEQVSRIEFTEGKGGASE